MKIGLFGGSFDPVHRAHAALAEQALNQFSLDRVIWIPAAISPFKKDITPIAAPENRLAMVQLACAGRPRFEVSDYEIKKGGVSYSIETLRHFESRFKSAQFFWILGADALAGVPRWKDSAALSQNLVFLVAGRGQASGDLPETLKFEKVNLDWNPISSTEIKSKLAQNQGEDMLDPQVTAYIRQNRLYGTL